MGKTEFEVSKAAAEAKKAVQEQAQKRPEYAGRYDQALGQALDALMQQPSFRYRLDGDALYKRYRDSAVKNGQLAMEDTLGQAAALTGGYGSSYGQTAAQQSYRRHMEDLNDKAMNLYDKARAEYDRQGQADKEKYAMLLQRENGSQNQYKQALAAWQAENQRLWNRYDRERAADYESYRDQVSDSRWQQEFEEAQRQFYDQLIRRFGW